MYYGTWKRSLFLKPNIFFLCFWNWWGTS